jgi:hypothetical protein
MPECRNCHREITKFDNDVCPYCGTPHPIDENYKTKDMTSFVDPVTGDYKLYKSKSKKTAAILAFGCGYSGAPLFYLGYLTKGLIVLGVFILLYAGLSLGLYFGVKALSWWAFLIPLGMAYLVNIPFGVRYLKNDSLKDKNGEFLR